LDTGGATLAVASHACADFVMRGAHEPSEAASAVEIAFTTPDVDAAFARAVAAGALAVTVGWDDLLRAKRRGYADRVGVACRGLTSIPRQTA
jgi:hypothetical protein